MTRSVSIIPPGHVGYRDGVPQGPEQWANRIAGAWQRSLDAIFETGRLIAEAKAALPHGEFGAMIDGQLPFSAGTAQRLMKVAADERLANPAHAPLLPPSWMTLYELTKLDDDTFARRIADGSITPDMQRRDVTGVAQTGPNENEFYPTFETLIAEIVARWLPGVPAIWEPCAGDGRFAQAFVAAGHEVIASDLADGVDFFDQDDVPAADVALCTNPPFSKLREFIDHAFAIGVTQMCLVLPERVWASGVGRAQFERHRPSRWINLDWRDDYLGKGGSPDRALGVAIWDSPCAETCTFDVWTRVDRDLSSDQINAMIREAYAASDADGTPVDFAGLEARTGKKKNTIEKRASRMGLGSVDRLRAAQVRAGHATQAKRREKT